MNPNALGGTPVLLLPIAERLPMKKMKRLLKGDITDFQLNIQYSCYKILYFKYTMKIISNVKLYIINIKN